MNLSGTVGTLNILGDESRIRLCALLRERELSVTDLVRVTGISQSRVSTHLARLREGGFVRDRKDGPRCFYALAKDSLPDTARVVLDQAASSDDPTLEGDQRRLTELEAERRGALPESFAGEMERHYSPGRTWQSLAVGLAALLDLGDVLDVGSGDGAAAGYLAPYCRSLTCIDTNPRMIEAARERLGRHPAVRIQVADVHDLPFPQGRLVMLALDAHEQREITAPYGERHPGFRPRALRGLLTRAGLGVKFCDVACREAKKPHFQVVLAVAQKAKPGADKTAKTARRDPSP
jgi:ArsR family transcriptional regulator